MICDGDRAVCVRGELMIETAVLGESCEGIMVCGITEGSMV